MDELNLHSLSPAQPRKDRKRVGRGLGSGKGRYSGRGIKGQKSRSGSHKMAAGFEGGQMPIDMRLPKLRGNTSADAMPIGPFRTYSQPVNLRDLEERFEAGEEVTPEALKAKRLIRKVSVDVKILGIGELSKALSVSAHGFSKTAKEKIEAAGGTVTWLRGEPVARPVPARAGSGSRPRHPTTSPQTRSPTRRHRPPRRASLRAHARTPRMFAWLANTWRVPELRKRLLFTALILALYRLGSWIPAPGVDSEAIDQYLSSTGGIFNLLNLFSGGALSQFSVFALGIMPYVTASIILQLMTVVVPRLSELQKEGESGTAKINQYTRYLTVVLSAAQALGYAFLFKNQGILAGERRPDGPDHRDAHRRQRAPHVDGRADHEAGDRQRNLDPDLRVDPDGPPARRRRLVERRADGADLLPADGGGDRRQRRVRPGGPAEDPDPVREADGRAPDDLRRVDVPAAAHQHGRRHPRHLRRGDPRLPADGRVLLPGDAGLHQHVLPAR